MKKITDVNHGQRVKVAKIRGPGELHRSLVSRGIAVGREIEIGIVTLARSSIMVRVDGSIFPISRDEAERIYVEPVPGETKEEPGEKETELRCSLREPVSEEVNICRLRS
jgi:Fe2+ transport system protein FeoA